jgi:ribonucleoside-diphosphate reductase alpha chain
VRKNVAAGYYDAKLLEWYTDSEFDEMDKFIKHDRDFNIAYAGMEQLKQKYLVKNKITKEYFETPQIAYMLIGAADFHKEDKKSRLKYIKEFYNTVSNFDVSLPTPIMAGVRTSKRQFASCTLIDVGDSLDSIIASGGAIVKYAANRAGLGVNVGRIRAVGSAVRNGEVLSTGLIPFIKKLVGDLKSCSQGGIRNASGNFSYPMWHYEYEDLIVLKNSKGTEDTRIRGIDYTVQINKVLLNRLLNDGNITLFSPHDVPGLYEAFFRSNEEFEELYLKYEADPSIRKKTIKAMEAFSSLILERKETGRIYIQFADNTNDLGTYNQLKKLVYMTNLCVEITEPTNPLKSLDDAAGEISLCNLAAYNFGNIKTPEDFERISRIIVRFLDNLLDYQDYPVLAGKTSTQKYRHLGIGVINLAYFLAKHNQSYTSPTAPEFLHPFVEAMSFYTIKASVELAKERGRCEGYEDTKWAQGILPVDKYRPFMDTIVKNDLIQDWEKLRKELEENGIRNATLMAIMPAETSAIIANATNGVEPPRALVSVKNSKDGALKQVVPEIQRLKNKYELLWDQKSPKGYLTLMGIFNKFLCMSISTNTSYNPDFFEERKIPMSVLLEDIIYTYQLGLRTAYYYNEYDGNAEIDVDAEMEKLDNDAALLYGELDVALDDEDCEACVI